MPNFATVPVSPIPESSRQAVLDAAANLQVHRSKLAARLAVGDCPDATVLASGVRINEWILEQADQWSELLSVRTRAVVADLRASTPNSRRLVENGLTMVSLYDHDGLDPAARAFLANDTYRTCLLGVAPVQMKIVDRRLVILAGPEVDGRPSIMGVTSRTVLEAALRYWRAAVASAIPTTPASGAVTLTARQQQVVTLLAADFGDEAIAEALAVSVRTVRSDVAAVLTSLGVRTRFAAAARLQLTTISEERP